MLHYKSYGSTGFSATEALIYTLGSLNRKRRGLFVMKRAAGQIIRATLLQRNEITHHINNLRGVKYLVYNILRNHLLFVHFLEFDVPHLCRHGLFLFCRLLVKLLRLTELIFLHHLIHLP